MLLYVLYNVEKWLFCFSDVLFLFVNVSLFLIVFFHFRSSKWCSGLRHSIAVLEVSLQTRVQSQAVSLPAVTGSLIVQCSVVCVRGGFGKGGFSWLIVL